MAAAELLEEVVEAVEELEAEAELEAEIEAVEEAIVEAEIEAVEEAIVEAEVEEIERPWPRPGRVLDEDELLAEAAAPVESPYDRPGQWFVVHTQSGYEKKVKQNLEARISSMNMEERIHEVVIPMEDVVEFKGGKKVVVQKKVFPGYLLVRCDLDDDSWYVIRNTPGVTGFVGQGAKPSPLPRRDVEAFLQVEARGRGGPAQGQAPPRVRAGRDGAGQGRALRRLLRRDRRDQRGPAQGQGARQHLRPRDPGRARVLAGRQALAPATSRARPSLCGSCHRCAR